MDISLFIEKVALMRKHQRLFYRDHRREDLIAAKELEREIDRALEQGIQVPPALYNPFPEEPKQPSLFE